MKNSQVEFQPFRWLTLKKPEGTRRNLPKKHQKPNDSTVSSVILLGGDENLDV